MKKIIFAVFSLLIATATISWDFVPCNIDTIKLDFAPTVFQETTTDGPSQSVFLTRFLHNKVGIYGAQTASCYFAFLDPSLIFRHLDALTVIFLIYFIYKAFDKKHWYLAAAFLTVPILPIIPAFKPALPILVIAYKFFAIIGVAYFLKLK